MHRLLPCAFATPLQESHCLNCYVHTFPVNQLSEDASLTRFLSHVGLCINFQRKTPKLAELNQCLHLPSVSPFPSTPCSHSLFVLAVRRPRFLATFFFSQVKIQNPNFKQIKFCFTFMKLLIFNQGKTLRTRSVLNLATSFITKKQVLNSKLKQSNSCLVDLFLKAEL